MTMYLPNNADRPTGAEAGEFLDLPPMSESVDSLDGTRAADSASRATNPPEEQRATEARDDG